MYRNLHEFVEALERSGELVTVSEPVGAVLEVAEITDRVSKAAAPSPPSASARKNDPRFFDRGGPALLFNNIEGAKFPLLINALGSYRRMEMALGCAPSQEEAQAQARARGFDSIAARIAQLVNPQPPRSLRDAISKAKQYAPLLRIGPKRRRGPGPSQQIVRTGGEIDLTTLPLIRCWPHDGSPEALGYPEGINDSVQGRGHPEMTPDQWDAKYRGRYITFAGIHTIHADDAGEPRPGSHNIGMYRLQLLGKDRLAMHWHMHHDGARHWRSWKKLGKPMPVAIAFGGESVLPYAATAPLPPGISELLMAGFLNGRGIEMVRAKTVPLWVPANAEIVIEGYVRTDAGGPDWSASDASRRSASASSKARGDAESERSEGSEPLGPGAVFEGPFGDHTGFYSLPDRYPVVEVSALTHRRDAILPATIVGLPPQEDYYLGKATERLFLPLLRVLIPDVQDYDLPMFGSFHNAVFVRIEKAYPMQGRRVMHAIWGAGQMAWTKSIFIVGDDVDVHDQQAVMRAAARLCRPSRDVEFVRGPLDILDHAAPWHGAGSKIGFDCTPKWHGEEAGAGLETLPRRLPSRAEIETYIGKVRQVNGVLDAGVPEHAPGWLLVEIDRGLNEPEREGMGRRVLEAVLAIDPGFRPRLPFVVGVGRGVDVLDDNESLFHWQANMDPGRDVIRWEDGFGDALAFDATPKTAGDGRDGEPVRKWPPSLTMDPEIVERVNEKWASYGITK